MHFGNKERTLNKILLLTLILTVSIFCQIKDWDPGTAYNGGRIVKFENEYYLSRYWSQNSAPNEHDTIWYKAKIHELIYFKWKDTTVYDLGDLVKHDNQVYIALHNTQGHEPSDSEPYDPWVPIIFPILEHFPASPGGVGDSTLLGIDSDSNGIRDDVERKIGFYIPDNPAQRAAMMQIAKQKQSQFIEYATQISRGDSIINIDPNEIQRAVECAGTTGALDVMPLSSLLVMYMNTKERRIAFREIDASFGGYVGGDFPEGLECDQSIYDTELARQLINE